MKGQKTHISNLCVTKAFMLEDTFNEIQKEIEQGYIRKASHPRFPNLEIYNYTDKCSYEGHWTPYTRICRGLVVDTNTREIIIHCIPKFFNEGELYADKVDKHNAVITLKEDGYMIQYTYHEDYGLIVTSRGSFDSKYANYAYEFLKNRVRPQRERFSFMLELCKDFPEDSAIIVTKHPKARLVCWTAVDILGQELDRKTIKANLPKGVGLVKEFSLEQATKYLTREVEGVVVRSKDLFVGNLFSYYPRVKVKTEWFLERHRLISNCTKRKVWELIRDFRSVQELEGLPDEFLNQMLVWEQEINQSINDYYTRAHLYQEQVKHLSNKELGLNNPIPQPYQSLVWCLRKNKKIECLAQIIQLVGRDIKESDTIDT